jgi:hypothetical protein
MREVKEGKWVVLMMRSKFTKNRMILKMKIKILDAKGNN